MGMMGMFIVHPRDPSFRPVDRDFVFIMSTYLVDPGTYLPKVNEMTDFNMWTWNSRVFPGIDPLPVRLGDRPVARDDDRRPGGSDSRVRFSRRQSRRLGVPLPQVASHDELDGP